MSIPEQKTADHAGNGIILLILAKNTTFQGKTRAKMGLPFRSEIKALTCKLCLKYTIF